MTTVAEADSVLNLSEFDPLWDDAALFKFIKKHLNQRPDDVEWYVELLARFCDEQADQRRGTADGSAMDWSDFATNLWELIGA